MNIFRAIRLLHRDQHGQLITEWTLLTATVIFPLSVLGTRGVEMIEIYFYRIAGVVTLPFP